MKKYEVRDCGHYYSLAPAGWHDARICNARSQHTLYKSEGWDGVETIARAFGIDASMIKMMEA